MNSGPDAAAEAEKSKRERQAARVGPAVFWITLAATLVFFWWLLIYDHGIGTTN